MILSVAVRGRSRLLVCVRLLVRGHGRSRHLVARRVRRRRRVAVSVGSMTVSMSVPVGRVREAVAVTGVSCISHDV